MANILMSTLGESPSRSGGDENLEPILGDGVAKAGMMVGILSTGKAVAVDGNSATDGISFLGIMDRSVTIDYDTAITDALLNNVIKPQSGRKYSCFIEDPSGTIQKGAPLTWGTTTAGSLRLITTAASTGTLNHTIEIDTATDRTAEPIVAYTDDTLVTGDTVALIEWK